VRSLSTNEETISLVDELSKTISNSFSLLFKTTVSAEPELLTAVNSNIFFRLQPTCASTGWIKILLTEQYSFNPPLAIFFYCIFKVLAISLNIFYIRGTKIHAFTGRKKNSREKSQKSPII